jgi:hypothetical protein
VEADLKETVRQLGNLGNGKLHFDFHSTHANRVQGAGHTVQQSRGAPVAGCRLVADLL